MEEDKLNEIAPVALVFFNRPEQFQQVFNTVKKAQPKELFLIQDGARENNDNDMKNIELCRKIAEDIDWDCNVHKNFSDENLGCGFRIFTGISWAFEYVDRLIVLEDDCLPSNSFFRFCTELFEKYKDDQRVSMITGMNHLGEFTAIDYDYFFAQAGSIAGWATWKRAWEGIDYQLNFSNDPDVRRLLKNYSANVKTGRNMYKRLLEMKKSLDNNEKLTSWSLQKGINHVLNSGLILVPRVNLMSNIGLTSESANSPNDIRKIPRGLRPLYRLKLYEMEFPLKHPPYMIEDFEYNEKVDRLMHPRNKLVVYYRKIESISLRLFYGDFKGLVKSFKRKLHMK